MTTAYQDDTDRLLARIVDGDDTAATSLLARHRTRLSRLVKLRLDRSLAARIDPSDVVQEAMMDAHRQLLDYSIARPLPFYPWLRQIALSRLAQVHRFHLQSQRRSVHREADNTAVADQSSRELAKQLKARTKTPSEIASRSEDLHNIQNAISELSVADREVLILRYVEQLPSVEAAAVLAVSPNTFAQRHLRAVIRLRSMVMQSTRS